MYKQQQHHQQQKIPHQLALVSILQERLHTCLRLETRRKNEQKHNNGDQPLELETIEKKTTTFCAYNILCTILFTLSNTHPSQDPNIQWSYERTWCTMYNRQCFVCMSTQKIQKKNIPLPRLINTMEINESILDFGLLSKVWMPLFAIKFEFAFNFRHAMHVGTCLMCIFDKFVVFFSLVPWTVIMNKGLPPSSVAAHMRYAISKRPMGNR